MEDLKVTANGYDFKPARAAMQRYIDNNLLSGISWAVMVGRDLVDVNCVGWADKEAQTPLRTDHIFRVFSNTKLITSCAALLLFEEGKLGLDDPIEKFIPQLGNRKVLRPGATSLDDTEPAKSSITIRQLLSHSSGLSYGFFDPGTAIYKALNERGVHNPMTTLADMVDVLAGLPLIYQPGTSWEYSLATDVVSRLVEVISGQSFDKFIQARILDPLGMVDTGFVVPEKNQNRLVAYYAGADLMEPMKPGLTRTDNAPFPGAYLRPDCAAQWRRRTGFNAARHGRVDPKPAAWRQDPAQAGDDCADDDQPVARRPVDPLCPDGRTARQDLQPRRRTDSKTLAVRSPGRCRRTLLGRRRRHAMVDLAEEEHGRRHDGAAPDVVRPPVLVRVQAAGV